MGLIALSLTASSLGKGVFHQDGGGAAGWAHALVLWGAWLSNWTWPALFGGLVVLLLRFPDGRLRSRAWRGGQIGTVVVCAVLTVDDAS